MSKETKETVFYYNNLMEKYNGNLIKRNGNVMHISINGIEYYYGVPSKQIRKKGTPNWTTFVEELIEGGFKVQ